MAEPSAPSRKGRSAVFLLRVFAITAAVLQILLCPAFIASLGRSRVHLLNTRGRAGLDGTVRLPADASPTGRALLVRSVSVDGGPFLEPASLQIRRDSSSYPVGTQISYDVIDEQGTSFLLKGIVTDGPAPRDHMWASAIRAGLGITLALGGLLMAVAGADRRAVLAGAALAGFGHWIGTAMLEPTLVLLKDVALRNNAIVLRQAFPRDLALLYVVSLLMCLPGTVRDNPTLRFARRFLALGAVLSALVLTAAQIPNFLEKLLTISQQVRLQRLYLFLNVCLIATATACSIWLFAAQVRLYRRLALSRADRARATLLGTALVVGIAPSLALILVQTVGWFYDRMVISKLGMSLVILPFVTIPLALVYSMLGSRVEPLRVLVRRAALYSLSDRLLGILATLPFAGALVVIYVNRDLPFGDIVSSHRFSTVGLGALGVACFAFRERVRHLLERAFFRERADSRRLMIELAERSRNTTDPAALERLFSREISRALHVESVALFVRDRSSGTFVCPGRNLPSLDVNAILLGAAGDRGVLDLDPNDRRSTLAALPEIERQWVEEAHARLFLPLNAADGTVIGLLTVGEKLSGLPYDVEDERLLWAVAASGALALEYSLLRSTGPGATAIAEAAQRAGEEDLARSCPGCSRLFSPAVGPFCPEDHAPLALADVPHVLADKYRFERRIGAGGMGVVYLARDLSLGRFVAVKTLPRVSPDAAIRLRQEARATARVLHPNLAVIFAAESWRGTPMLVLEYLEGGTLAQRIGREPIPIARIVEWGIALSGALEAAHEHGVLHRDIKPSNVGFTASGAPKLLDFGLASLLEEPELLAAIEVSSKPLEELETASVKHLTVSGRIVGTVPYLAPEAILGEPPQAGFDLWSLALTLYEATTGSNPFFEMPAERTFNRILSLTPPAARTVRADCPDELSALLAGALARKPDLRPGSARELHRAFRKLAPPLAA